jgi:hypothetical protein
VYALKTARHSSKQLDSIEAQVDVQTSRKDCVEIGAETRKKRDGGNDLLPVTRWQWRFIP